MDTIDRQTARRYVLGRQGLWPGRRCEGKSGTESAIRQSECIQIDTINSIARSHDLALLSRVSGYRPEYLNALMYEDREFFDYGSILMVYPSHEVHHWRAIMERRRLDWEAKYGPLGDVHAFVMDEIRSRGPLANRDFEARTRIPGGFRTIKDTGAALYRLWAGGYVETHSRRGFERVYALSSYSSADMPSDSLLEAERYFAVKALGDCALASPAEWARRVTVMVHRRVSPKEGLDTLTALVNEGAAKQVCVEGRKEALFFPASDAAIIERLASGSIPDEWNPFAPSTTDEVHLLAPLDNVIWDRARTLALFDFDYVWEVYKPEHLRKWGYYTMPILWGDALVGRLWPQLNRKTGTLSIEGIWLEDKALWKVGEFVNALGAALNRLSMFVGAKHFTGDPLPNATIRKRIQRLVKS
jgi:uncharacterized protein YcaQ